MDVEGDSLDQTHAPFEGVVQLRDELRVRVVMELRGLKACFTNSADNLVGVSCGEDANGEHAAGKMRSDRGNNRRIHAAAARREDETNRICTKLSCELRIGEICVGTDLDEH